MKSIAFSVLSSASMLFFVSTDAGAEGWDWYVGAARRQADITFSERQIANPALGGGPYLNYTADSVDPATWSMMDNFSQATQADIAGNSNVTVESATWNGTEDDDDTFGLLLGASKVFSAQKGWTFAWNAEMQFLTLDAASSLSAGPGSEDGFNTASYNVVIGGLVPGSSPPNSSPGVFVAGPPTLIGAGLTNAVMAVDTDFEATVLNLGWGVQVQRPFGALHVEVGGGAIVTIADSESCFSQSITTGTSTATYRESDSEWDVLTGLYLKAGLSYTLTESLELSAAVRWDGSAGHIETDHAEVDFDSLSYEAKLGFRF